MRIFLCHFYVKVFICSKALRVRTSQCGSDRIGSKRQLSKRPVLAAGSLLEIEAVRVVANAIRPCRLVMLETNRK
jgi:hypothetical protein